MLRVIVQLRGGLGNQLFQYAAGRALSLRFDGNLFFDISELQRPTMRHTKRQPELDNFSICGRHLSAYRSLVARSAAIIPSLLRPNSMLVSDPIDLKEVQPSQVTREIYLKGYWQTYRYAEKIGQELANDLRPAGLLDAKSSEIISLATAGNSVSVHVRRGDYATLSAANKYHGLLDLEYYENAIKRAEKTLGAPEFFVFSDDILWCAENLKFGNHPVHFVDHNTGADAWRDLICMQSCKSHIIANSSFSWWGAWMSNGAVTRQGKSMVIAPRRWYTNTDPRGDFFPKHWILL